MDEIHADGVIRELLNALLHLAEHLGISLSQLFALSLAFVGLLKDARQSFHSLYFLEV